MSLRAVTGVRHARGTEQNQAVSATGPADAMGPGEGSLPSSPLGRIYTAHGHRSSAPRRRGGMHALVYEMRRALGGHPGVTGGWVQLPKPCYGHDARARLVTVPG